METPTEEGYVCNISEDYREAMALEAETVAPVTPRPVFRIWLSLWLLVTLGTWVFIGYAVYCYGEYQGIAAGKKAALAESVDLPKRYSGKVVGFVSTAEEAQRMIDAPGVDVVYGVSDVVLYPNQPLTIRRGVTLTHMRIDGRDLQGKPATVFDLDSSTDGVLRDRVYPEGTTTKVYGMYIDGGGLSRLSAGRLTIVPTASAKGVQ